jgi:hemoglobin
MAPSPLHYSSLKGGTVATRNTNAKEKKLLYDRLGGRAGVTRIVRDFLDQFFKHETVQNAKVIRRHEAAYHPELTKHWIAFITERTGGPSRYAGRTMRSAHAGLAISDADFDATIALMEQSLVRAGVSEREKNELLRLMRGQRKSIVEAEPY